MPQERGRESSASALGGGKDPPSAVRTEAGAAH